jgi:phospholipid transport system substrate-binding protein
MYVRRRFLIAGVLVAALGLLGLRTAAAASPEEVVRSIGTTGLTSLTDKGITDEERERRFREILHKNFDMPEIAKFTLGVYWRSATEQQRAEYAKLFEDFVVKSYSYRFKDYDGEQFRVTQTVDVSATDKVVQSEIARQGGPPIRMNWRMRGPEQYKVVDVVLEGVSMLTTQRDEFTAVIRNNGGKVDGLLTALRDRIGQGSQQ